MTPGELDAAVAELRALEAKATPGPWEADNLSKPIMRRGAVLSFADPPQAPRGVIALLP